MSSKKKIEFQIEKKLKEDFYIKLDNDGVKVGEFLIMFIERYVYLDKISQDIVDEYRKKRSIHNRQQRARARALIKKGLEQKEKFGLEEDEEDRESPFSEIGC